MMGVKPKEQKLFYNFSLAEKIPKDHFLYRLDQILDLAFIYSLAKPYYSNTGQPGVDPVVLLKMMLIGYFYDIRSERKLAQEMKVNLAFMYFLGYDLDEPTPNHSVLSKARKRFGHKIFEQFFDHVVEQCNTKGLIQSEKAFIDSSLIPANAALSSVIDCDEKIILKHSPREYLKLVEQNNPSIENSDSPKKDDMSKPPSKPDRSQKKYSKTDPEASLVSFHNKPTQLAYKQHISVDNGPARIITTCVTTPAAVSDEHKLPHLISVAYEKHNILPAEVGADTKYGTADNYQFLLDNQIKPAIPVHGGKNRTGLWVKEEFIYDKEQDQYICPAGYSLKNKGFMKKGRKNIYRTNPKNCQSCCYRKQCTKSYVRSVTRHVHEQALEKAKEYLKTPEAQHTIEQRSKFVETAFAFEKKDLGLSKAKFRGLTNVAIQSFLTSTAYNLKKLLKYSKGLRQKSKIPINLPVLQASAIKIQEKFQKSEMIRLINFVKNRIFSIFLQNPCYLFRLRDIRQQTLIYLFSMC